MKFKYQKDVKAHCRQPSRNGSFYFKFKQVQDDNEQSILQDQNVYILHQYLQQEFCLQHFQMQNSKSKSQLKKASGRWTRAEHQKFMDALEKCGRNWALVQKRVKTRTLPQIRSHAQKVFLNMSDNDINALIGFQEEDSSTDHPRPRKSSWKDFCDSKPLISQQISLEPHSKKAQHHQTTLEVEKNSLLGMKHPNCEFSASHSSTQEKKKNLTGSFKMTVKPISKPVSFFTAILEENQQHFLAGGDFYSLLMSSASNLSFPSSSTNHEQM